ncbi:Uncharacterized protein TCM_043248 [Theobroma cacao]|uniref:Uncharacterized protein n=1 Tax=Theobroma cacao TaxID=3641 RepID=A0A061FPD9_THECC|nr:Uncharacterized protein TCM_043248 [Theobroma cacao]
MQLKSSLQETQEDTQHNLWQENHTSQAFRWYLRQYKRASHPPEKGKQILSKHKMIDMIDIPSERHHEDTTKESKYLAGEGK